MVANAGIGGKFAPIQDSKFVLLSLVRFQTHRGLVKLEDWDHLHSINIRGVFLCYKYAMQ